MFADSSVKGEEYDDIDDLADAAAVSRTCSETAYKDVEKDSIVCMLRPEDFLSSVEEVFEATLLMRLPSVLCRLSLAPCVGRRASWSVDAIISPVRMRCGG